MVKFNHRQAYVNEKKIVKFSRVGLKKKKITFLTPSHDEKIGFRNEQSIVSTTFTIGYRYVST